MLIKILTTRFLKAPRQTEKSNKPLHIGKVCANPFNKNKETPVSILANKSFIDTGINGFLNLFNLQQETLNLLPGGSNSACRTWGNVSKHPIDLP